VSKLWVKADIEARAKQLFFPNGNSKEYGSVDLYDFEVTDFQENELEGNINVGEYCELTSLR
jgi:hypothetical protein